MEIRREIIHMANSMHTLCLQDRFDIEKVTKFNFRSIVIGHDVVEKDLMIAEILYHAARNIPIACVFSDKNTLSKHVPNMFISDLSDAETKLMEIYGHYKNQCICLLYTSPSPRDLSTSRMPSSA